MSNDQKEFPQGIIFKLPNDRAPDFVKGKLSIKRKELIEYLQSKDDEWLNYDLNVSKNGKPYIDINDWKPNTESQEEAQQPKSNDNSEMDDLPF